MVPAGMRKPQALLCPWRDNDVRSAQRHLHADAERERSGRGSVGWMLRAYATMMHGSYESGDPSRGSSSTEHKPSTLRRGDELSIPPTVCGCRKHNGTSARCLRLSA
jgi:hypothetical protein